MLEVKNLCLRVPEDKLHNITLSVGPAQCHIIVGPTGAGKSLLLESIIGFKTPSHGSVHLDYRDITRVPVEKRGISYVPQDLAIFPHLTVEENIFYSSKISGKFQSDHKKHINELVNAVGITYLLKRETSNLSGGELQRMALVRALATGCQYILLDEPFSSLHETLKRDLWLLLKQLQKRFQLGILMVTHNLAEAFFLGDTISILLDGGIEHSGPKPEVYNTPGTSKAALFVGVKNLFPSTIKEIEKEDVAVVCEDLSLSFTLSKKKCANARLEANSKVFSCIRSEDVMILRKGLYKKDQDNLLEATITDIYDTGSMKTVILKASLSGVTLESLIPEFAANKMELNEGDIRTVSLKNEKLFLLQHN